MLSNDNLYLQTVEWNWFILISAMNPYKYIDLTKIKKIVWIEKYAITYVFILNKINFFTQKII